MECFVHCEHHYTYWFFRYLETELGYTSDAVLTTMVVAVLAVGYFAGGAAVQYFIESAGAAIAPFLAGLIAVRSSLHDAILIVCEGGWVLCAIVLAGVAYLVPRDIEALREAMRQRAEMERWAS